MVKHPINENLGSWLTRNRTISLLNLYPGKNTHPCFYASHALHGIWQVDANMHPWSCIFNQFDSPYWCIDVITIWLAANLVWSNASGPQGNCLNFYTLSNVTCHIPCMLMGCKLLQLAPCLWLNGLPLKVFFITKRAVFPANVIW